MQFGLRKVVGGLVAGQPVLVETTGLLVRVEQQHLVTEACQRVGAGQTGWPGAQHRNLPAGAGGTREDLRLCAFHQCVGGVALQTTNGNRLSALRGAHTDLLTQVFGRANPRAHATQRVGLQNRCCRAAQVALGNAPDEGRHIDVRWAGRGARGVKAVEAALSFQQRLPRAQARAGIGKTQGILVGAQAMRAKVRMNRGGHAGNSCAVRQKQTKTDRSVSFCNGY